MAKKVQCAECYHFEWDGFLNWGQCGGRIDLRNRDILAKKSRVCDQFLYKEQSVGICEECGHEIMLDPSIDRAIPPPCPKCGGSVRQG